MKFLGTRIAGLLFASTASIVSAAPIAVQPNVELSGLSSRAATPGDISSTYCDVHPDVFPCSEFCKGNQLADFCRPEWCKHNPGHWTCVPKYIDENDTGNS
ncbi:unnamed protein product [Aureobasidium vineae]|uniref:Uncharacterized protein n=1 Tax=Aureobasidium vineae TaxID=2773715 RepID=A0A9N8J750_9PEZI|nr:unnamed protein product [Aureobasidium vineae]